MQTTSFEWDSAKNEYNLKIHSISFEIAQEAFYDPHRIIAFDTKHSTENEKRWFCIGKIDDEIVAVRFTYRKNLIRIFGAGYWRRERKIYEEKNHLR